MSILSISQANCKNCYRCVRHCPVKAIRIKNSQAETIESLCVLCGICLSECPQQAKVIENNTERVKCLIESGEKVVASIAPSFPAVFSSGEYSDIYDEIKKLGFYEIEETAWGADAIAGAYLDAYRKKKDGLMITSACPVIKNLIEKYYPDLIEKLAPIVSPMIAHGKLLKKKYGEDIKVVFIGPCLAKKEEAKDLSVEGCVDEVISFEELTDWIEKSKVAFPEKETKRLSMDLDICKSRSYPLPGGMLKSLELENDVLSQDIIMVDGIHNCMYMLEHIRAGKIKNQFIEMLACDGGCIAGPLAGSKTNLYERRFKTQEFIASNSKKHQIEEKSFDYCEDTLNYSRTFEKKTVRNNKPNEKDIRKVLHAIGKTSKEKELDCGACGYPSCRRKAEAVCEGMAELEMCMPYMRTKAESLANIIIDATPNGIIVVDKHLKVQEVNHVAERILKEPREEIIGMPLSIFMDDTDFAGVIACKSGIEDKKLYYKKDLILSLTICYIEEHHLALGILVDITKEEIQEKQLKKVKEQTLEKAQEVINRQMRVAQEVAGLLGETTAESKVLLLKLMELVRDKGDHHGNNN